MPKSTTIGAAVVQQNVLGLDVAMDDAVPMRVVERVGHLARDAHRLVDAELRLAVELLAKRLALDVGHDVERQSVGRAGVEQRQDVRMLERRRRLDLDGEPLGAEHGGELRLEHLDRDLAIVLEVRGEVDGGHAAGAQLPLDSVAVGERGTQSIGWEGRRRHGHQATLNRGSARAMIPCGLPQTTLYLRVKLIVRGRLEQGPPFFELLARDVKRAGRQRAVAPFHARPELIERYDQGVHLCSRAQGGCPPSKELALLTRPEAEVEHHTHS